MGIDDVLVALLLVAAFAASALQKLVQRSKAKRQMTNEERVGESRRLAEQNLRTAQRRGAARHPAPVPAQPKSAKIEDVIRRLMGEETGSPLEGPSAGSDETDEEDWRPLAPPPIRRAPPTPPTPQRQPVQRVPATPPRQLHQQPPRRQAQMPQRPAPPPPSARPERQRPARTPAEMIAQPHRREAEELTHEEIEQRENERRWHEEMEQRKKQQAAQQAKQRSPEVLHSRTRLQSARRRLFHSTSEVRRAFILSEVLGPPRAMRDLEERT